VLDSKILDVAIGVVLMYLLISLMCSAITESISRFLDLRAKFLLKGIDQLLSNVTVEDVARPLAAAQPAPAATAAESPEEVASRLALKPFSLISILDHPIIGKLAEPETGIKAGIKEFWHDTVSPAAKNAPSYLPASAFRASLVERLLANEDVADMTPGDVLTKVKTKVDSLPSGYLKDSLKAVLRDTGEDLAKAQKAIEAWFDDAMLRVSGWYKRRVRWFVVSAAVVLVFALNADTVRVGLTLWQNQEIREVVSGLAAKTVNSEASGFNCPPPGVTPTVTTTPVPLVGLPSDPRCQRILIDDLRKGLGGIELIGWRGNDPNVSDPREVPESWPPKDLDVWTWLFKIGGMLISILAVQQGASFWFNLLKNLVNLRSSGPPPPAASSSPPTPVAPTVVQLAAAPTATDQGAGGPGNSRGGG
jgi:hypothetical protein